MSQQSISQSNGCHRAMGVTEQWMSQNSGCHKSNGCHRAMGVTELCMSQGNGCHRTGMSKQRDVKAKGCQSKGMSKQRDVTAKGCHSKGMTKQTGLIFLIWTFRLWRKSRTKAPFSHLPFSLLDRNLAQKLLFHIFHFQIVRGSLARKLLFTQGSLARKLRFHIHLQILRDASHKRSVFTFAAFRFWRRSRTNASFAHFPLSDLEGCLARKLRFHICHFQILKEVSHERFVCTSSTFRFWRRSRTHERFVFTFATFRFGGKSRTNASFAHLPLSDLEASLARASFSHLPLSDFETSRTKASFFTSWTFTFLELMIFLLKFLQKVLQNRLFLPLASKSGYGAAISDAVACSSIVVCKSAFANRIVMAAWRLLGAAAVCVILLSFAAGDRTSYWSGCIKVAIVICQQIFSV